MSEADPEVEEMLADTEDDGAGVSLPGVPSTLMKLLPDEMQSMMATMQEENGIAKIMLQPMYVPDADGNPQVSQAEVVADIFNLLRLDTRAIGDAVDLDLEAERMTPQAAALKLQSTIRGENVELLEHFGDIEARHEQILEELVGEEALERHQTTKQSVSHYFAAIQNQPEEMRQDVDDESE